MTELEVRAFVAEGWAIRDKAYATYGVVFMGEVDDSSLAVDEAATAARRATLASAR